MTALRNPNTPCITRKALLATASLGILAVYSPASAMALPGFLSFADAGDFTGWTRTGSYTAVATNQTFSTTLGDGVNGDKIIRTYNLTPAAGQYMAAISTSGTNLSNIGKGTASNSNSLIGAESVFGLTSNTFSTLFSSLSGRPTNYGAMIESTTLTAGTTYTFYWSYAAQDYKAYNDGVFFSLTGNGLNEVDVLASNGGIATDPNNGGGAQGGTQVLGSFGATQWAAYSFTVATTGVYKLGFGAYNWGIVGNLNDTAVDPLFFVGASAGTVTTPNSSTPIDTNAAYYAFSNLGTSVNPDFKGGTLRIDASAATSTNVTVESYNGNTIDAYGHNGIFSGVLSGSGGLTIKDSIGGGKVVFTGADTYSGGTTINTGATLQIGIGETTGTIAGNIADNGTLIFNRSNNITYAGAISGTGSLTQAGSGTLILTGANTYSGGTTISAGTLQIGNGETTGSITGDIANNTALVFNRSDAITYASAVSGTGSLMQAGSGTLILTGANTYTGGTTISAGTLQIGDGNTAGSLAGDVLNNGALIFKRSDVITYAGAVSSSGSLTQAGSGTLILTGTNTHSGGTTISAGTLQIGNGGTTGSIAGNVANSGTLAFNRSNTLSYSGVISGSGGVSVSGGGTVVLIGSNTYTGQTSIASGSTLQLGNGGTTGSIVSDVVNQGILAFNRSDTVTFNGNVTGNGTLVQNGTGKVIVTTNYTGKTIVNSGTLQIGNGSTSGTVTGNIVNNATVVYGQAAATSYTGIISGSGGVSVSGGGVVILNGANTYTGPTTVTAGSLIIGDSTHQSATVLSGVTVSNNAIVGGYGMIGGNLVASGGTVSPGNSIGTLTVNGNYTQSSSATLKIEVTPTANDKLVVNGTAQLGGTLAISLAPGNYGTNIFSLLSAGTVSGTFATVTYSGAASNMVYGIVYAPKEVDLAMTPTSSGQIYGDLITAGLDTAVELNQSTLDRLNDTSNTGWSVWSKSLSGASHTAGTDTLASFNSQLWGVISGVDYQFSSGHKLSGVFAYSHDQIGVHGEGDKASVDGYFFALAGHIPANQFIVDLTGFVQHNDIYVVRDNGGVGNATGQTNNLIGGGSVEVAYPVDGGDVLPFARLTIANVDTDAFNEAGTLGLSVASLTRTSVRGSFGLKLSHDFTTENGTLIRPHFLIGMENEFGQTGRDTAMTFANTAFTAPAPTPENVSALLGAGISARLAQRLDLSLETSGRLSANQQEGIISFGAKYRF